MSPPEPPPWRRRAPVPALPFRTTDPPLRAQDRRGFTLLELVVVLGLFALLVGLAIPLGRSALDQWAVRTVRDRVAVALHRTRLEARRWGGARIEIDGDEGRLRLWRAVPDSLVWEDASPADHRVRMVLPGGEPRGELTFDALGLGVVASRTVIFRRGLAEARLVISSRGRGTRP